MPKLGPGIKEGVIAAWRKEVGDLDIAAVFAFTVGDHDGENGKDVRAVFDDGDVVMDIFF